MIARFHYDGETLDRFLHDTLGDEGNEVAEHLETCELCQEKIDVLSRQGLSWDEVGDLLDGLGRQAVADPMDRLSAYPTFLQPTNHPKSLGLFARFEIMEILGRGGMGIVMRGYDTLLDRHCAVKVLAPELATSAAARKRFSREAKSAAAVVHPHVVPIQTVDEHEGLPYLVMPVVEGQSLQQRVDSDGPLSVIETVRIATQIADGLAAAHAQGLVHRDIKPANILLENGVERVQITDFGLARAVDDVSMTRSGVIAGTPQYMSPEQAHGDSIDHRSDLFSLGSVIYFMLTGRSPFRAETTMGVLNRIGNDQPKSLRSINSDVPEWLETIAAKLLSKSPAHRHQTASEVAALLQEWHAHLQQPDVVQRPTEPTTQAAGSANLLAAAASGDGSRVRRWLIGLAMFGFLAFAGAIVVLETNKGTIRIETNSNSDVPIIIRQGDEVVEKLTVSQGGTSTRLKSGRYEIEIEGSPMSLSIKGDQVKLVRGETWIATITELKKQSDLMSSPDTSDLSQRPFPVISPIKGTVVRIGEGIEEGRVIEKDKIIAVLSPFSAFKSASLESRLGRLRMTMRAAVDALRVKEKDLIAHLGRVELLSSQLLGTESVEQATRESMAAKIEAAQGTLETAKRQFLQSEKAIGAPQDRWARAKKLRLQSLASEADLQEAVDRLMAAKTKLGISKALVDSAQHALSVKRAEQNVELRNAQVDVIKAKSALGEGKADLDKAQDEANYAKTKSEKAKKAVLDMETEIAQASPVNIIAPFEGKVIELQPDLASKVLQQGDPICVLMPTGREALEPGPHFIEVVGDQIILRGSKSEVENARKILENLRSKQIPGEPVHEQVSDRAPEAKEGRTNGNDSALIDVQHREEATGIHQSTVKDIRSTLDRAMDKTSSGPTKAPAKLATTPAEVADEIRRIFAEQQAISKADVHFRLSELSGSGGETTEFRVYVDGQSVRSTFELLSNAGTTGAAKPQFKSRLSDRDPILDIRELGLSNWWPELALGSFPKEPLNIFLPPVDSDGLTVTRGKSEKADVAMVAFPASGNAGPKVATAYWLSPTHDNRPVFIKRSVAGSSRLLTMTIEQHTDWRVYDGIWFPAKITLDCRYDNSPSKRYVLETLSAKFNSVTFPPGVFSASHASPTLEDCVASTRVADRYVSAICWGQGLADQGTPVREKDGSEYLVENHVVELNGISLQTLNLHRQARKPLFENAFIDPRHSDSLVLVSRSMRLPHPTKLLVGLRRERGEWWIHDFRALNLELASQFVSDLKNIENQDTSMNEKSGLAPSLQRTIGNAHAKPVEPRRGRGGR